MKRRQEKILVSLKKHIEKKKMINEKNLETKLSRRKIMSKIVSLMFLPTLGVVAGCRVRDPNDEDEEYRRTHGGTYYHGGYYGGSGYRSGTGSNYSSGRRTGVTPSSRGGFGGSAVGHTSASS